MFYKIIVFFLICFSYKLISSIINFQKVKKYQKLYMDFLVDNNSNIFEYKSLCINLFKKFGINDAFFPISQAAGYGQIANFNASLFKTFPSKLNIFVGETIRIFNDAKGLARSKILECFSPKYWIDCIIFLPRNLFIYLNVSADSVFIQIFQLIYWILGIVLSLFSTDIVNFIKSFFMG